MDKNLKSGKNPGFFHFILVFLIFAGLVTAAVLVLRPIEQRVRDYMNELRDNLAGQIEDATGFRLEYGSASPSIISALDLRNVRLLRHDNSVFLSVSRVRLTFSLWNILLGKIDQGFNTMRIDRPVLSLDTEKDADFLRMFTNVQSSDAGFTVPDNFLPDHFQVVIHNGEGNIHDKSFSFKVENLQLEGNVTKEKITFTSRWNAHGEISMFTATDITGATAATDTIKAELSGRINGDYNPAGHGIAIITISSLETNFFKLQPLSISAELRDNKLNILKAKDRIPFDISAILDIETSDLKVDFSANNFDIHDFITFTGPLQGYNPWAALRLSGSAGVSGTDNELNYSVDLNGYINEIPFMPSEHGSIVLSAEGNNEQIVIRNFLMNSSMGMIRFIGSLGLEPFSPVGTLSFINVKYVSEINETLNAEFVLSSSDQEIVFSGTEFNSGGVGLSGLGLYFFREDNGFSFHAAGSVVTDDYRSAGQTTTVQAAAAKAAGSFSIEGYLDYEPSRIQTSLMLDSFSIQNIIDLSRPFFSAAFLPDITRTFMDRILISTEVFFSTDYANTLYNAPEIQIRFEGSQPIIVEASLSGTNRRFDLSRGTVIWNDNIAELVGYAEFPDSDDLRFSLEFSYRDLIYYASGMMVDDSISIRGTYGFEVFLSQASFMGYSGYAQVSRFPLPFTEQNAYLSFLVSLRYDSASFWAVDLDSFELTDIKTANSSAVIRISGRADQDTVILPYLLYEDSLGSLSGNLLLERNTLFDETKLQINMSSAQHGERFKIDAVYANNNNLKLDMDLERIVLNRFSRSIRSGLLYGNVHVDWNSIESFSAEANLPHVSFIFLDQLVSGSAAISADNSELLLRDLKLHYGARFDAEMPFFRVNRSEGFMETAAMVFGSFGTQELELEFRGEADFHEIKTWLDFVEITDSIRGDILLEKARFDTFTAEEPFRFDFSILKNESGSHISVNGGPRNMLRFLFTPEQNGGSVYAALSAPSPVRGSFTGSIDSRTLNISTTDLYVDMEALWKFMPPVEEIAFPSGIVTGRVQVTGPLRDPEFYGTARVTGLRVKVPQYIPEDIRPVPITVTMNGSEMTFGPVPARVGNGYGTITGWFEFERWIPNIFSLDISVDPENAIPGEFEVGGVLAKGRISGDMNLAMADMVFDVTGELTAHNTIITLTSADANMWTMDNTKQNQTATMINLVVKTGRQVEFFWPSVEFPMLQAFADVGSGIHVTGDVMAQRFSLIGNINLRSGEIFYLDRNFYLREGTLFFNETESRFDPRITARAEIRDQIEDTRVTISMIIDNSPLQSFIPRFVSNPPLSQLEILSVLGQQQIGDSPESRDANILISFTADALTQFTVMRTLQREIRNFLGLDMFSVRTSILQNVVFQATGLRAYSEENVRAGTYFDNTTIFLGKFFSPNIFAESMLTWKYDPARQSWGGIRLEPEIGLEMRNPLFDIKMNVIPLHPENWFINDITFSFIWRWSF